MEVIASKYAASCWSLGLLSIVIALIPTQSQCAETLLPGYILLGDSQDMEVLATSAFTNKFRKLSNTGFYLHQNGILSLKKEGIGRSVADVLMQSTSKFEVAEISIPNDESHKIDRDAAKNYFAGADSPWQTTFIQQGFLPVSCNINGLDVDGNSQTLADWVFYKTLLDQNGLSKCGAFGDPNGKDTSHFDFDQPYWNLYRAVALVLGGVALDTPPSFALARGDKYLQHVIQVVKWGRAHHLRVCVVLAVDNDLDSYEVEVRRFTSYLLLHGAYPTEWVVGGYEDGHNNEKPVFHLGSESDFKSLTGLALLLAGQKE